MRQLNLPPYQFRTKEEEGTTFIFDQIRKKFLVLTPEEWVRQNFIEFLLDEYNYPRSLFKCEEGLKYNKMLRRSDILIYDRNGHPFFLIECKAPEIKIDKKVFQQVSVYNQTLRAPFIAVTNGLEHYICKIDLAVGEYEFMNEIPAL